MPRERARASARSVGKWRNAENSSKKIMTGCRWDAGRAARSVVACHNSATTRLPSNAAPSGPSCPCASETSRIFRCLKTSVMDSLGRRCPSTLRKDGRSSHCRSLFWIGAIAACRSPSERRSYHSQNGPRAIDFTTWITQENGDDPLSDERKRKAIVEDAVAFGKVLDDLSAKRFSPEWILYVFRLASIIPEQTQARWDILNLTSEIMNSDGEFQRTLACAQLRIMQMAGSAITLLYGPEQELSQEQRQRMEENWRTFGEHTAGHLQQLEEFGAPYWHAQALAGLTVFGILDKQPQQWLGPIRDRFQAAAIRIDRPDWITMVNEVEAGTRSPLWLLGY